MKKSLILSSLAFSVGLGASLNTATAGVLYKDGEKYVKFGGRIQVQYHQENPESGATTDDVFFRRLRPYIEGSLHENWKGKFQWDMGKGNGDNELSIKDAYMQYKGDSMKVTVGNYLFPFSREALTSSKYQQLVERTFVGDHNYGSPDRQVGVFFEGKAQEKKLEWAVGFADGRIDPDSSKIDFDTAANDQSDWNEGWMVGGRVSYNPFGPLKMKQGDFSGEQKATVSLGAFSWSNDEDNITRTANKVDSSGGSKPDVDSVTGLELSGAYRNQGISLDVQYNIFNAETIDSSVTSGIYRNGETKLKNFSIEAGYMVLPSQLEVVASLSNQDADNYSEKWKRTELGLNYFVHKHDVKYQLTFRSNENMKGVKDSDKDEIFLQAQYVF